MLKIIIFTIFTFSHFSLLANTIDCQNLYVGRISITKTNSLNKVVFLNNKEDPSGSYWVVFTGWTEEAKKSALSVLMAAKISSHRVNVVTEATNGCSILSGYQVIKEIYLANNP